jgi:hypothetical protein
MRRAWVAVACVPGVAVACLLGVVAACGGGARKQTFPRDPVQLVLPSIDGGEVDFRSLRGKPVVVHFFTTWSVAALSDVEELRKARDRVGGRLTIVGVGMDPDGTKLLLPWRDGARADWWIASATPDVLATTIFGAVTVTPTTVVLDATGRMVWRNEGQLPPGKLASVVQSLVSGSGAP